MLILDTTVFWIVIVMLGLDSLWYQQSLAQLYALKAVRQLGFSLSQMTALFTASLHPIGVT